MLLNDSHFPLVPKLRMSGATPLLSMYAFMTCTATTLLFFYLINCRYYWALVTDEWMKSTQRRTYSSATLSTKNPTQPGPGISPCLHSFRLVTTLLKHDKASWYFQCLSRNKPVKWLINWKGFGKQWSWRNWAIIPACAWKDWSTTRDLCKHSPRPGRGMSPAPSDRRL
jgi:hypothetical protein